MSNNTPTTSAATPASATAAPAAPNTTPTTAPDNTAPSNTAPSNTAPSNTAPDDTSIPTDGTPPAGLIDVTDPFATNQVLGDNVTYNPVDESAYPDVDPATIMSTNTSPPPENATVR
jgi:hypothetical protein